MYTDKQLLKLAGKLAIACQQILQSNPKTLSDNINKMEIALLEYDNAIISNIREEISNNHN